MKVTSDEKNPKSARLEPTEHKSFISKVESFLTKGEAAAYFGFSIVTLDTIVLKKGRGSYDSINKIRTKLNILQSA